MNRLGLLSRRLSFMGIAAALLLGVVLMLAVGTSAHASSRGSVGQIVQSAQSHDSQSWISKLLWHHLTGCPLYPGAALVNLSQSSATFVTADVFGNVLNWYEAQHRKKAELEVASDRGSVPGDVASYSLIMKHPDTSYLVTVYKLRGEPRTFINASDIDVSDGE